VTPKIFHARPDLFADLELLKLKYRERYAISRESTITPHSVERRVPVRPLKAEPRGKLRRGLGHEFVAIEVIDLL
jgi:hypothetical protein